MSIEKHLSMKMLLDSRILSSFPHPHRNPNARQMSFINPIPIPDSSATAFRSNENRAQPHRAFSAFTPKNPSEWWSKSVTMTSIDSVVAFRCVWLPFHSLRPLSVFTFLSKQQSICWCVVCGDLNAIAGSNSVRVPSNEHRRIWFFRYQHEQSNAIKFAK